MWVALRAEDGDQGSSQQGAFLMYLWNLMLQKVFKFTPPLICTKYQ